MSLFNTNKTRISYISTETGEKVYPVLVDVKKGVQGGESIQFVSSDINTGMLSVAFMLDNADYNVSGAEVICTIQRPDATVLEIPCKHISNNVVEVYLGVNGTSQGGTYTFDFKVYKGGDKVVGTPILNYTVSQSISSDNSIEEDDRLPILNNLIIQVNNAIENIPSTEGFEERFSSIEEEISSIKENGVAGKGDKGDKGDTGLTPDISIGNVTTLEPNQQATVTRRGTNENPIFDFGIPKGEKGDVGSDGGSSDCNNGKPIVEYIHQGNKEIYFTNINWDTGEATTKEPHGLTGKTEIMIVPNDWSPQSYTKNLMAIPQEYIRNSNRITVVPSDTDTNILFIRQNDGTSTIPVSATATGNLSIDCTKFHFEIPIAWTIDNIPGDLMNYTIVSVGYVKSGGSYRYTHHWYKDEDGNVKQPSYIGLLGHPTITNASCTHGVYAHQIWEVHIEDGSMVLYSKGVFLGRRNGFNYAVIDGVMENTFINREFGFKPQGLVKLATYSNHYAYMSNGTIIRIYDLRG